MKKKSLKQLSERATKDKWAFTINNNGPVKIKIEMQPSEQLLNLERLLRELLDELEEQDGEL